MTIHISVRACSDAAHILFLCISKESYDKEGRAGVFGRMGEGSCTAFAAGTLSGGYVWLMRVMNFLDRNR